VQEDIANRPEGCPSIFHNIRPRKLLNRIQIPLSDMAIIAIEVSYVTQRKSNLDYIGWGEISGLLQPRSSRLQFFKKRDASSGVVPAHSLRTDPPQRIRGL
jgi:hypothetical protein